MEDNQDFYIQLLRRSFSRFVKNDDDHSSSSSSSLNSGSSVPSDGEQEEMDHEEDPISEIEDDDETSDADSCISNNSPRRSEFFDVNGLVMVEEGEREFSLMKRNFLCGLGAIARHTAVVAIQKNLFLGPSGQARRQTFCLYSKAMAKKRGDETNGNVKMAFYGASRDEISSILAHGFGKCGKPDKSDESYGYGIYLYPDIYCPESLISSPIDENGLRHVLVCRVILGKLEEIRPGSEQFHPSSEEFDSGVDSLIFPKKYIVWSTNMNTHILPEYVISTRAPVSVEGFGRSPGSLVKPTSPWMPFATLIAVLSNCLPSSRISLIKKFYGAFQDKKISRLDLIQVIRQTAGDKLLVALIKSFRAKHSGGKGAVGVL